jgi:hypothetical protein
MLIDLLTKEDFHRFKQELLRDLAVILQVHPDSVPFSSGDCEKMQLGISDAQLGVFLRAAMDAGIITNENKTAVLRCVVLFVNTHKSDSISVESLRKKFYEAERSTKDSVKDLLMEMFKRVHKY